MTWADKYTPKSFSELLLPAGVSVRKVIRRVYETGECPASGLLFYDTFADGGTGKTTTANLIVDHLKWDLTELQTTGNKISDLGSLERDLEFRYSEDTRGFWGEDLKRRIILCNEISKSSPGFIDGLRNIMDKYKRDVLFLFTDNDYVKLASNNPTVFKGQRIIPLDFDTIPVEEVRARVTDILQKEGVNTSEARALLEEQLKRKKCSIRGILVALEAMLS